MRVTLISHIRDGKLIRNDKITYEEYRFDCFSADGTIYEQGTPSEIFDFPKKEKTISFVKKLKNITISITSQNFNLIRLHRKIQIFSTKYGIPMNENYRLQICVEELIVLV